MHLDTHQSFDPFDPKTSLEQEPGRERSAAAQGGVVTALIIIMVGVVLLLNQLGVIPRQYVPHLLPMLFMLGGILVVVNATTPNFGIMYVGDRKKGKPIAKSVAVNVFWGGALLLVGFIMELNARGITNVGWEIIWPLGIIAAGVYTLWRHTHRATGGDLTSIATDSTTDYPFDLNFLFSGTNRQISDKDFKGGRINALFGGFKLDLSNADMKGDQAIMEINAVFGGGELIIPPNWEVVLNGSGIFGGVEDKTRRYPLDPALGKKTLVIQGAAVFGGFTIKN
jgi:predicted membrane protein